MNNQELFKLVKNSKLAQVARPIRDTLRAPKGTPGHQIIYTPRSSSARSNFGLKTTLPSKIGYSHIVFNDIDNKKSMPDVERYGGSAYNQRKFQESGIVIKNGPNKHNRLFPFESKVVKEESILNALNLRASATKGDIIRILKSNKNTNRLFQQWLLKNHPDAIVQPNHKQMDDFLMEFLKTHPDVVRNTTQLNDYIRRSKTKAVDATKTQGTAGFTYAQRGRLTNTPNGVQHGTVIPGRILDSREAGVAGFVANLNERSVTTQINFAKNYPGKHRRQFITPFKVLDADVSPDGSVQIYVEGVKAGSWVNNSQTITQKDGYNAPNPLFENANERNSDTEALENLLGLISKDRS